MSLLQRTFGDSIPGDAGRQRFANSVTARRNVSTAHRIRMGLTGLGAIFLFVMIAAAGVRPTATAAQSEPAESLAVLGVAPGASPAATAHGAALTTTRQEEPAAAEEPPAEPLVRSATRS